MTATVDAVLLNDFLSTRSYVDGFSASKSDLNVFGALPAEPEAKFVHARRWYRHIKVLQNGHQFASQSKSVEDFPIVSSVKTATSNDDDEVDLFGEDEVDPEAERVKAERIAAYNAKKATKQQVAAKSEVVLDIKPWDEETDMAEVRNKVKAIVMDGLVWGEAKLQPVAFGVKKLVVKCVVEDDKVSIDALTEKISEFEDHVQSVDIVSFNKI